MWAVMYGKIEVVRELLKRGAKKELKDNSGDTVSWFAGRADSNKEEIKALLR